MANLLEELNESQRKAVEYCDGASLVIAGAGSGKTRVLTYKIAYLLQEKGLKPWQILALTFTNKAAREMKERIGRLVGSETARYLQMGTFHSIFARILRAEADTIGFTSNFTIYDQSDARSLVKAICKEMQLDDKVYKPSSVADTISMAKNHLILPAAFVNSSLFNSKQPKVHEVYQQYVLRCHQANAMDFDDLLVQTYLLFERHEDIRRKYVERFCYVLVDEYQDTNATQQKIVYQLTRERQRVCVVGDDAQSIYSFRGANIDNILGFNESYNDTKLFKLEQNYRSTQLIVQAANSLIQKNQRQIPKDVYSRNDEGDKLTLKPAYSDKEEAIIVCNDILQLKRKEHGEYSDFAILYRTNAQSRSFEEQMLKMNIPYRIYGGMSFYQRKEIKDIIAYYRLVTNPNDEEALKRIINYPTRGIGDTSLSKIVTTATAHQVSLWQVISHPELYHTGISKATLNKIDAFRQLIEGWQQRSLSEDAYALGHAIIMESGISRDIYSGHNPEDISRQENIEEFLNGLQDFVESNKEEDHADRTFLSDFLQEVALLTDLDSEGDKDESKVSLMTIHSAKGLEFPTVFVVGLEENIFPSPMCVNSLRELEEERRLLYVAITRAERHCILTCAQNRYRYGRMEYDTPSRFIRDIDPRFLFVQSESKPQDDDFGSDRLPWRRGQNSSDRWGNTNRSYGSGYNGSGSSGSGYNSSRYNGSGSSGSGYNGSGSSGSGSYGSGRWNQNPRPVASQFVADQQRRAVPPRQAEKPVDPFSPTFKRQMAMAAGMKRVSPSSSSSSSASAGGKQTLAAGDIIEHMRFGRGTVVSVEGSGENEKATVQFDHIGTKQLLLKFAKFKKV